jgi:zinc protease
MLVSFLTASVRAGTVEPITFTREILPNGLRVIFAPMDGPAIAPVVHVRVLYHVGSRDERPDRQGFAHMFEHMMFRGSKHVKSEEHMQRIVGVGGISNAFTSFDQTTYINTVPNNHLEMALWLEADRMASFRVSQPVLETERNVVHEEWRQRYGNQPYGTMFQDLFKTAFQTHNYTWMPIGDMAQLAQSTPQELQDFHDLYYVPNNATLIIAGKFDVDEARKWVNQFFGWIPKGKDIVRATKPEPVQTETRTKVVYPGNIPVGRMMLAWKTPDYSSDDHLKLDLLGAILGGGRSSRLHLALVENDNPVAVAAQAGNYQLQDPGFFINIAVLLPNADPKEAMARIQQTIDKVIAEGVTAEELEKARTQARLSLIQQRSTAENIASVLGEEEVFGGDANRANEFFAKLDAITVDDLKAVAARYLKSETLTVVKYLPGVDPNAPKPEEAPASGKMEESKPAIELTSTGVASPASATATSSREIVFPAEYPTAAPVSDKVLSNEFNKGVVDEVNGVQVITLTDNRLPVAGAQLIIRTGGHASAKVGVADMTAAILTRGAGGMTATEFASDLESRGISLGAGDDGDTTRLSFSTTTDQLDHAAKRFNQVLTSPDFPADQFARLKQQSAAGLAQSLVNPANVADRELDKLVFGDSPLGRKLDMATLTSINLDDLKTWYSTAYRPENAILVFGGQIEPSRARELASVMLAGWSPAPLPTATYNPPAIPPKRQIILVDNPGGAQAAIRMGIQAYDLRDEDRFAGAVASQILSAGIDSRMDRVLRAQKGLTYGSGAFFRPSRVGGMFNVTVDTKPETTAEAITSAFGVLEEMKANDVTQEELSFAKRRVAGLMVLDTQTIESQGRRRVDGILNNYPIDYYDNYAKYISQVEASQVRQVLNEHVDTSRFSIVVVGPAEQIKAQLEALGEVTVVEMPMKASGGAGMMGMPR